MASWAHWCCRCFIGKGNGLRSRSMALVGGTRSRHFAETNFKSHKLLENAQTPTSRVHAVLGALTECKTQNSKQSTVVV